MTVKDVWAPAELAPIIDTKQDVTAISNNGLDVNGYSTFKFSRPMDTLELTQDMKLECGKSYDFWWVGHSD